MEYKYVNERYFTESKEELYALIKNSEDWPSFIEDCKEVKILERDGNQCIRYMKSLVNHKTCEMKTKCVFYDSEYKMVFKQIESPWPIKSNRGKWYVEDVPGGGTKMVLIHCVVARYGIIGDICMRLFIGKKFVYGHAEKVLNKFEEYIKGERK